MFKSAMRCCLLTSLLMAFTAFSPVSAQESDAPDQAFAACLAFDRAACSAAIAAKPDNLTALFMRGLAAELDGDDQAAFADFDTTATREPRHFGAQLWRYVAALTLDQAEPETFRAYLDQSGLPPWPQALGHLYLGETTPQAVLALAEQQPPVARNEALCAAQYHIGRRFLLAGDTTAAAAAFRAVLATGATHVFEYQAADRTLQGMP